MGTKDELEPASLERQTWHRIPTQLRTYDTDASSQGASAREAAYLGQYLYTVQFVVELARFASIGVVGSILDDVYAEAREARRIDTHRARTGNPARVFTEAEQINASGRRAVMEALARSIECLECTLQYCFELSASAGRVPNHGRIDDIYRKVLVVWLVQVTAWKHAGPDPGRRCNPPPSPLPIVQGMV